MKWGAGDRRATEPSGAGPTYLGQYTHTVDEKGRVSLPARFRDGEPGQTFVATRGIGPCLFLYAMPEWSKVAERFERQQVRTDPAQRRFYLQLMQNTIESSIDNQGRITIPTRLAELARIEREVLFVGAGAVIEMWDPQTYADYVGEADEAFDQWLERFL